MKNTRIDEKRELLLVRVLIVERVDNGKAEIVCQANEQIVPTLIADTVKLLARKIIEIMPKDAINLYIKEGKSLIDFLIEYSQDGEYSIAVDSAPPVLESFDDEIDKITGLLDNAVQNLNY